MENLRLRIGDLVRTRTLKVIGPDGSSSITFSADNERSKKKKSVFCCLLMGTEPLILNEENEGDALDVEKVLKSMGWAPAVSDKPSAEGEPQTLEEAMQILEKYNGSVSADHKCPEWNDTEEKECIFHVTLWKRSAGRGGGGDTLLEAVQSAYRNFQDLLVEKTIYINGKAKFLKQDALTYEEIVELTPSLTDLKEQALTITYKGLEGKEIGTLTQGESVEVHDEMVFNVQRV